MYRFHFRTVCKSLARICCRNYQVSVVCLESVNYPLQGSHFVSNKTSSNGVRERIPLCEGISEDCRSDFSSTCMSSDLALLKSFFQMLYIRKGILSMGPKKRWILKSPSQKVRSRCTRHKNMKICGALLIGPFKPPSVMLALAPSHPKPITFVFQSSSLIYCKTAASRPGGVGSIIQMPVSNEIVPHLDLPIWGVRDQSERLSTALSQHESELASAWRLVIFNCDRVASKLVVMSNGLYESGSDMATLVSSPPPPQLLPWLSYNWQMDFIRKCLLLLC